MSSQKYDGFCFLNNSTLKRLAEKQLGEEACVSKRQCMPKKKKKEASRYSLGQCLKSHRLALNWHYDQG